MSNNYENVCTCLKQAVIKQAVDGQKIYDIKKYPNYV